ncbi:hypothetical protein BVRB_4g084760 [Beta vulgaris subsp. vulgaris]|nr:hypothetical protein BVRB_4g084760 [Beta vulgaris subsp. vulgaris]
MPVKDEPPSSEQDTIGLRSLAAGGKLLQINRRMEFVFASHSFDVWESWSLEGPLEKLRLINCRNTQFLDGRGVGCLYVVLLLFLCRLLLGLAEANQELIVAEGGISLLSITTDGAEDPQTLRMVAGAKANLCGNDKLQVKLRAKGGIRALLGMVICRHPDVLSQIARGIANYAKCDWGATQGMCHLQWLYVPDKLCVFPCRSYVSDG